MNKNVIVTGGSRGIGADIVRYLASNDYNVILNYNKSEEEAKKIQEELKNENYIIKIFKADVSDRNQVKELVDFAQKEFEKIDVVINNAGISQHKLFTDISDDDWEKMLKTNLYSVFYMCQESVKSMIQNQSGCIINISSIWGQEGASCESHYAVSKAGIDGLTKSLAKELGPSNIRVNSIAPGFMKTDMNSKLTPEEIEDIKKEIPLMREGTPRDISKCVKWLIEDEYVTGQVISINGGWYI